MIVERSIGKYVCFASENLISALTKININKMGLIYVVHDNGILSAVLTDGDIRRWLTSTPQIELEKPVGEIANSRYFSLPADAVPQEIATSFSERIQSIPLVDAQGRLVAVAFPRHPELVIGDRTIGEGHPSYIIAEIGNNHNGDEELGRRLIELAYEAGADCAKFQMRDMTSLYGADAHNEDDKDLGAQYTLDLLSRFNLSPDALFRLFDYCKSLGMEPLCTPWDVASLEFLESYGMKGYKLASADLTNHGLLRRMAATGKPLICSTGMSSEAEIKESVDILQSYGSPFALLHCNSTYPAPLKDINLKYMDRLSKVGQCPVGYSGHERGWSVPLAAIARGAKIIEKHFTIDRNMEGNDHRVSLLPEEFREMVLAIRAVEESLGLADERKITQGEMMNREVLAKSIYARTDIQEGTTITADVISIRSPGQGLQPNRLDDLLGMSARRTIKAGTPFFVTDVDEPTVNARNFRFARPWGIPVRWHDYRAMLEATNLQLLEYHLSYKDMEADLEEFFNERLEVGFVVHAPELFKGDHILDLSSRDEDYRAHSVSELQRVIELTRDLGRWHTGTQRPLIITNMGGFSTANRLPVIEREALYETIAKSLAQLDMEGVEVIAQTMPPFPWHFGGQSYHNLFMNPDEIVNFCQTHGLRVCFDISHSQLACNEYGWSMRDFIRKVGPHTAHLHIVDAKGVDGEGLQIGDGNIDFAMVAEELDKACPAASFVPEIWQGHKNSGAGFWFALDRLETWFSGDECIPSARR